LLQRGDREQVLRDLTAVREPFYMEVADLMLDTDGLSPGGATSTLAQLLAAQWQRSERAA
jgi:shikimate kinase